MSEYGEDAYEAAYDDFVDSLRDQFREEFREEALEDKVLYANVVEDFASERLKSYYVANPDVLLPSHGTFTYAQTLLAQYPTAALVFAVSETHVRTSVVMSVSPPPMTRVVSSCGMRGAFSQPEPLEWPTQRIRSLSGAVRCPATRWDGRRRLGARQELIAWKNELIMNQRGG